MNSAASFRQHLELLPILFERLLPSDLPYILAYNVELNTFFELCDECKARGLAYEDGTIIITRIPTVGHERVCSILEDIVFDGAGAGVGAGSVIKYRSSDIAFHHRGRRTVQPDVTFRPSYFTGNSTPTLLIQVVDSSSLKKERINAAALFAAAPVNAVQAVLVVKLIRYQRPAVPQAGVLGAPRTVGQHTFSDPGFVGDRAPAADEIAPISEMDFIYLRRGVANPSIVQSGLGPRINPLPAEARRKRNDPARQFPGVAFSGGSPGPFVAGSVAYLTVIPWGDILHVQAAGPVRPAAMTIAINAAGPGIVIDPYAVWAGLSDSDRYTRRCA